MTTIDKRVRDVEQGLMEVCKHERTVIVGVGVLINWAGRPFRLYLKCPICRKKWDEVHADSEKGISSLLDRLRTSAAR